MSDNDPQLLLDLKEVHTWAADCWSADSIEMRPIRAGGSNAILRFEQNGQGAYLRLTTLWPDTEIIGAQHYLNHLAQNGAPVCRPLPSRHGRLMERMTFDQFDFDGEVRASVTTEIIGETITNRWRDPKVYRAWGAAVAHMHLACESYDPAEHVFLHYRDEWAKTKRRLIDHAPHYMGEFELVNQWFESREPLPGGFGLTHGDCNAGNFIWDGEQVSIIDFDEPQWIWYAADISRPFREVVDFPRKLRRSLMETFIAGYHAVRPVAGLEISDLAWMIRFKNLDVYAWALDSDGQSSNEPGLVEIARQFETPTEW